MRFPPPRVTSRRSLRRRLVLGTATTVLLLLAALPASAHNSLSGTVPTAASTVARTPAEIVLTFDQPAVALGTQVVVTGPDGPVQLGAPRLVDETVTQALQPGAAAGAYTVVWRVTSADGHPISGEFGFTSDAAGVGTPSASAPPEPPAPAPAGQVPFWAGWLAAAVALAAAAVVLRRLRRR